MKTEELLEIGLTEEQATKVLAINGKDIERYKKAADTAKADLEASQEQLSQRDADIEKLKKSAGDVDGIKQQLADLQTKYTTETEQYQKQIADRDFNDLLKTTAEGYKPRDLKAVMPFLDVEKLKASKNQEADIKTALEAVKKDNAYLFQDTQIPKVVSYTPGSGGKGTEDTKTRANEALRSIFGRE